MRSRTLMMATMKIILMTSMTRRLAATPLVELIIIRRMMRMITITMMIIHPDQISCDHADDRNILGTRNLSEILAEREDIGDHMHKVLMIQCHE